jgi:hypothetical protein
LGKRAGRRQELKKPPADRWLPKPMPPTAFVDVGAWPAGVTGRTRYKWLDR